MGLLGGLPYAEEMLRCLRRRPTVKPQPEATLNGEGDSGIDPAAGVGNGYEGTQSAPFGIKVFDA